MAQRTIIGINGDLLPFDETVDKLQTNGVESGNVTWVPDEDVQVTSLVVTANGNYNAGDDGVYGWNYVAVFVTGGSVTGTIDGVNYTITVDNDGYLVYTEA